jgi:uncharacterized protein (UPF0332 family)/predicted nucleotidyltransferase
MAAPSTLSAPARRAPHADDLPARFRARVLAAFPGQVERIVLFGSRARGEPHAGSDWDLAVFLDHAPTERDEATLREIGFDLAGEFDTEVQAMAFARHKWLATDELACNIRDQAVVVHGPAEVPMIERPVLQHARTALGKAERLAELSAGTVDDRFEGVIHGAYYAMFHAARAALLAVEGTASTNHGRVVETFGRMVRKRRLGKAAADLAQTLKDAYELRAKADYDSIDLTEAGRQLRERVAPFLAFCRARVEAAAARA